MSTKRKKERAAKKALEIATKRERKAAAKAKPGALQSHTPVLVKSPSARPYRAPEPKPKPEVAEAVKNEATEAATKRDGMKLLSKIESKGGKDILIMMRDSEQDPQELAETLMRDEAIVMTILGHGSHKDRVRRLLAAIEYAPFYLKDDDNKPSTIVGERKRKRQEAARKAQDEIAKKRKNPRTRVHIPLTVADVMPVLDDQQIVLKEIKEYLELNTAVRSQFIAAISDLKATRILVLNVGPRFDTRVKELLAAPGEYQNLLAEAGKIIRGEQRKYDAPDVSSEDPAQAVQESEAVLATRKRHLDALARYDEAVKSQKEPTPDPDDTEAQERMTRYARQEASLRKHVAALAQEQPS